MSGGSAPCVTHRRDADIITRQGQVLYLRNLLAPFLSDVDLSTYDRIHDILAAHVSHALLATTCKP